MGTHRLTLLRHGHSQAPDSCPEDFERALTRRGLVEAQEMASRIVHRDLIPELILVSPAERAWTTASIIAEACELDEKQIRCARELYLALPETVWRLLTQCDSALRHILICGHNPGLTQIARRLGPKPLLQDLPTAGLASAVWHNATWATVQPETASSCDWDDPETLAEDWV
jgi:phosphohistidine phosphatase